MKKVLIALSSVFTNETFKDIFFQEGFSVATTDSGQEALNILTKNPPDIVIADANLPDLNAFGLLKAMNEKEEIKRTPLIVYSRTGSEEQREMAMDYEARDFVIGLSDSPKNVVLKAKAHLGEQKAYMLSLDPKKPETLELARDLGYGGGYKCQSCSNLLSLHLLRNLNLGKNTFKLSLVCSKCSFRYSEKNGS